MKLYHIEGTCSLGIQALLEEVGEVYELHSVSGPQSEERALYRQLNPKGKVPALQFSDGSLLTEFPIIAIYIARRHEKHALLGNAIEQEVRILELMEYIVSTGHMLGFARIARPDRFSDDERDFPKIQSEGRVIFQACLDHCEKALSGNEFICGCLSLADFALLYLEYWAVVKGEGSLGPNCQRHYQAMSHRPAVARVLGG